MAYNKGVELQNKINSLSKLILVISIFKFGFFFYSFISIFFWFLNCFEIEWLYLFSWLFIIPFKLVTLFYQHSGMGADFSLAIIGLISFILGFIFEFLLRQAYPKIYKLQEELEKYLEQKKTIKQRKPITRQPRTLNKTIQNSSNPNSVSEIYEDKLYLIYVIQPHVHKMKNNSNDAELTLQEIELWRQRINKSILSNIQYTQPLQKGYYRKNLFLVYKDFNYVDNFIYYIRPTIESIIADFQKYGIDIQFNHVLSAVMRVDAVEKELDLMDTILSLNFVNTFILTKSFKYAYNIKNIKKYVLKLKGEYNLSKNLSISNVQPLYVFKNEGEK